MLAAVRDSLPCGAVEAACWGHQSTGMNTLPTLSLAPRCGLSNTNPYLVPGRHHQMKSGVVPGLISQQPTSACLAPE